LTPLADELQLVAQWWSTRKHIANWWLWIVVDAIGIGRLPFIDVLYLTSVLFAVPQSSGCAGLRARGTKRSASKESGGRTRFVAQIQSGRVEIQSRLSLSIPLATLLPRL